MAISYGPKLNLLVDGLQGEEHYEPLMQLLRAIDALVQCTAISCTLTIPPITPADGDVYVLPILDLADAWIGHSGEIARWSAKESTWEYYVPRPGWVAYAEDEEAHKTFVGGAWVDLIPAGPATVLGFDVAQGSCTIDGTDTRIVIADEGSFFTSAIARAAPRSTGKRYFELQSADFTSLSQQMLYGVSGFNTFDSYNQSAHSPASYYFDTAYVADDGQFKAYGVEIDPSLSLTLAAPIGFAVDLDIGELWVMQGGVALIGDPEAGTGGTFFATGGIDIYPFVTFFSGFKSANIRLSDGEFTNAPPTGFVPWNS